MGLKCADYDVLVIGSGPAAYSAAITCRLWGLTAIVVSTSANQSAQSANAPSESLHPGCESILDYLGVWSQMKQCIVGNYAGVEINGHAHRHLIDDNSALGFHICKNDFVELLKQRALHLGVNFVHATSVKNILRDEGVVYGLTVNTVEYISKYIIDASGREKVSARLLDIKSTYHSAPYIAWTGKLKRPSCGEGFFNSDLSKLIINRDGWLWLAREYDGSVTFTQLTKRGVKFELNGLPGVCEKLYKYDVRWRIHDTLALPGLIMTGDAASCIDPAAGQGILNALYWSMRAIEAIVSIITNPDKETKILSEYNNTYKDKFNLKIKQLQYRYHELGIL